MARRPRNCELALVQSDRELRESDWTNLIGRDRASEVWDCGGARAYRISLRTIRATVYDPSMMKTEIFPIADIYVPVKRRATLNLKTAGHHDMHARLRDMDRAGVAAGVIYHGSQNNEPFPLSIGMLAPVMRLARGEARVVATPRKQCERAGGARLAPACGGEAGRVFEAG